MDATYKQMWRRFLVMVFCFFALLVFPGCASYFRTGQMSYQELQQRNQETQQENNLWLKPGTVFYGH